MIPQLVHKGCRDDVTVFFRVRGIYRDVRIEARSDGGQVLHSQKKLIVAPGEMESIVLKGEKIRASASDYIEIGLLHCAGKHLMYDGEDNTHESRQRTYLYRLGCRIAVMDEKGIDRRSRVTAAGEERHHALAEHGSMVTSTVRMENTDAAAPVKTDSRSPKR